MEDMVQLVYFSTKTSSYKKKKKIEDNWNFEPDPHLVRILRALASFAWVMGSCGLQAVALENRIACLCTSAKHFHWSPFFLRSILIG